MAEEGEVRRLLTCPLCAGLLHTPRYFPCLHSFCTPCVAKHALQKPAGAKLVCPACGVTASRAVGVADLPVNHLVAKAIQELPSKDAEILRQRCGICKDAKECKNNSGDGAGKHRAVILCEECMEFMCERCRDVHQGLFKGKKGKHRTVSLCETKRGSKILHSLTRRSETEERDAERCVLHKRETLTLYCRACDVAVCVVCKGTQHAHHDVTRIEDAVKELKANMDAALKDATPAADEMRDLEKTWKEQHDALEEAEKQIKEDIDEYAEKLLEKIRMWRTESTRAVEAACEKRREEISKNLEVVRKEMGNMATVRATARRLASRGRPSHVIALGGLVVERSRALDPGNLVKPDTTVRFKLQRNINPAQFTDASIGSVITNEKSLQMETAGTGSPVQTGSTPQTPEVASPPAAVKWSVTKTFSVAPSCRDAASCKITGMCVGEGGDIYVVDNHTTCIRHYSENGVLKRSLDLTETLSRGVESNKLIQKPLWDCAVLANRSIVVASGYGVHILDNQGEMLVAMDSGSEYTSVVVCHSNNKAVAYSNRDCRVVVFEMMFQSRASSFVISLKYAVGTLGSVAWDPRGNILVSDMHADNIKVYSPVGRKLLEIGGHGKAPGYLIKPRGVCTDTRGYIYVADKGNHRVQRFSARGQFEQVVLDRCTCDGMEMPVDVVMKGDEELVVATEKGLVHIVTPQAVPTGGDTVILSNDVTSTIA